MKYESIIEQWQKDCKVNDTELGAESLNIPYLHGKYLKYYGDERMFLVNLRAKRKKLNAALRDYYSGALNNQEDLKEIGREPWKRVVLKSEVNSYIDGDSEMINLNTRIGVSEEKINVLEYILKGINSRGFQIKSAIDWHKMTEFGG
jgi:hypothetical protein